MTSISRLLASGALTETRSRLIGRTEGWIISACAIGGALGFSYHIGASMLVAALKMALQ
jgi:hypothetical protein